MESPNMIGCFRIKTLVSNYIGDVELYHGVLSFDDKDKKVIEFVNAVYIITIVVVTIINQYYNYN